MIVLNPTKSIFKIARIILQDSPDTDPEMALRLAQYIYQKRGQYKFSSGKLSSNNRFSDARIGDCERPVPVK